MANNSLAQIQQCDPYEVTYKAGDNEITLNPQLVKDYLVSGDSNAVTYNEVVLFIRMCQHQGLNPFLREAFCIKFQGKPATLVTAEIVFEKRARNQKDFRGFEAGIYVGDGNGNWTMREGEFYLPGETILGGWCKIYVDGYDKPIFASVAMNEYIGRKKDGSPNQNWATRPATMIRKVAKAHAFREAFPTEFRGLYISEEMGVNEPYSEPIEEPIPIKIDGKIMPENQNVNVQPQEQPITFDIPGEVFDAQPMPQTVPQEMPQEMPVDDFAAAMM